GTPSMSLTGSYRSTAHPPAGANYTRLSSAEVDTALEAADSMGERRRLDELMGQLAETLPALPLFEARAYLGFSSGVAGPDPNATVEGPFWNLETWRLIAPVP
ncbi:MAG: hypothetical protein ACRDIF_06590, partial [Actinomycetota bacterium]